MTDSITIPPPPLPPKPGRSSLLVAAGIMQIVLGALCAVVAIMSLVMLSPQFQQMMAEQGQTAPTSKTMGVAVFVYAALALLLIWTGIGAVRCRRWVRPIMQCVAWGGLVGGVVTLIGMCFMFPVIIEAAVTQMQHQLEQQSRQSHTPMPPAEMRAMMRVMIGVVTAIIGVVYVLLPGFFVWIYTRPSVKACCEQFDPQPRWTDHVPTPAIGLALFCLTLAFAGISIVFSGAAPLYTMLLTGLPARAIGGGTIIVALFAAQCAIQRRPIGWWVALLLLVMIQSSFLTYFATQNMAEYNQALGLNAEQLEMMNRLYNAHPTVLWPMIALWLVVGLAFMFWVKRYVKPHVGHPIDQP